MADRCSTAKGVVGIRNKNSKILKHVSDIFESLNVSIKKRTVQGYSITKEVYCCNSVLRRFIENFKDKRIEILSKKPELAHAYFAGVIDGDGSIYGKKSSLRIYYNKTEIKEARKDALLLRLLGYNSTIKLSKKIATLYILKPRKIAPNLLKFINANHKLRELKHLAS